MAELHGTPEPHVHPGIGGFFKNDTMGLPNWAWLLIIGAGIGAAIIIPKLIGGGGKGNASTTGTTPDSGLGLAIDPTTGLPYAVEGLVPAGGVGGSTGTQGQPGTQGPPGPPGPKGPPGGPGTPASLLGHIPLFSTVWEGGRNPNGTQRWWFQPAGGKQTELDVPFGTRIWQGGQGRWWYMLPGGQQKELTQERIPVDQPVPHADTTTTSSWPGDTAQIRMTG